MIVDLRSRTLTVGAFGALAVAGVLLDHFSTFVVAGPPTSQRPGGMLAMKSINVTAPLLPP
jgi:uncharacterized membrane protein